MQRLVEKVVHAYANHGAGGAVQSTVEYLARSQRALGLDVEVAGKASMVALLREFAATRLARYLSTLHHGVIRRRTDPKVVHVHGEWSPWTPIIALLSPDSVLVVVSPHGGYHVLLQGQGKRRLKLLARKAMRLAASRPNVLFHALSSCEAEAIERLLPGARTYVAAQTCTIEDGLLRELRSCRAHYRSEANAIKLVALGRRAVFTKGLDILINAIQGFRTARRDLRITLRVIGPAVSERDEGQFRALLSLADIDEVKVDVVGALPRGEALRIVAQADALVQFSRHEGFPLSVAEALIVGVPVCCSDQVCLPGQSDIQGDWGGVLFAAADVPAVTECLQVFASERELLARQAMIDAVRAEALFAPDSVAAVHVAAYDAYLTGL